MVDAPGAPLSRRVPRVPRISRVPRLLGWLPCLLLLGAWAGAATAGPAIAISPDPLEFYDPSGVLGAPPGTKQTTFYSVRNTGDAPLAVSGMAISGPDAALMAFDDTYDPSCGTGQSCAQAFALAPGEERWFMLQCTAAQGGYFAASLGIASNAASGTGTAALSCIGLHPPVIQVSPAALDFGIAHYCDRYDFMCGPFCETRPRTQTLTLTNAAPAPSELAFYITPSLPATEDFLVDNACPEDMPCVIGAGGSLPIEITFRPYHIGAHTAPLTIVSQYPGQAPVAIPFYAEGGTGQLAFDTPDFLGAVPVGQTLVTSYTVRNAGNSCLSFHGPDLHASGLALVGTYPPDLMLQAGESYSWSLACTPPSVAGAGGFVDFYLHYHGAAMATQDVYCQGLGAALAATPESVSFTGTAEVPIGTAATQRVTVRNIGNLAADLAAITPSDPHFTATLVGGSLPLTLAPDATAEIDVTFTPTTHVRVDGTLALDLATGEDATIPIAGDGVLLAATISPAAVSFGRITHPDAPARQLTLHNTGDRPLTVNGVAIGLPGDFSASGIASGATLAAGATLTFDVHATPTALGRRRSSLVIDLDKAPDLTVPLTAIAVDGALDVTTADAAPDDYAAELGGVVIDAGPRTSTVTLHNNKAAAAMAIATCAIAGDAELALATACPLTIAPGATAELAIAFAPTAEAESTAVVTVTGTGFATGTLQIEVSGIGLAAPHPTDPDPGTDPDPPATDPDPPGSGDGTGSGGGCSAGAPAAHGLPLGAVLLLGLRRRQRRRTRPQ